MKNEYVIGGGIAAIVLVLYLTRKPIIKAVKNLMTRNDFINTYAGTVKAAAHGSGLFPSLFMAQAILESSDKKGVPGNSGLAKNHNNFFGIKISKDWKGKKATMKTREVIKGKEIYVNADFRKYDTPEASFMDRVLFLKKNKNYQRAGVFDAANPIEQAQALQRAGYATDPNYARILKGLIDKYNLTILDPK